MPLSKPTLSFELGLTAGFNDSVSTVAWTDITPYVLPWGTARGREPKKPPAHFDPGIGNLTLNNRDRRFDPTNTAGPYWPNLKPARVRLRIKANWPSILTPNQASIESGVADWTAFANCTLARSTTQAADGAASLRMTSVAAGSMQANTATGRSGRPVTGGQQYTALASFRSGTGSPSASIAILWYDANGAGISTSTGATVTAGTGGWTQATVTATAPANAAFAALFPTVVAGGAGELHYLDKFSLHPGASTTWVAPYPVFTGYVKKWPPEWTSSANSTVRITAVDALGAPLNLAEIYPTIWETMVRHDRPIAWYRMGESSGTTAVDSTSNRHDGAYQGGPTLGLDGLVLNGGGDKAVRFVAGSRLSIPEKTLVPGYPFTFECWFRCGPDTTGGRNIFSAYDGPTNNWRQLVQIFIQGDSVPADAGKIIVVIANPYPTGTQVNSTIAVDDNAVHHLVVRCASSTDFKLYIDGVDRTFAWTSNAHNFPNDLITGYAIGNNPAATFGGWPFGLEATDVLDEVVLYDYALSATRIAKHYGAGVGYPGPGGLSGVHVVRLLEEADWVDYDVDTGESELQTATVAGSVVANLQKVEDSEQGAVFVDESGLVTFQSRHALAAAPYTTSQATFGQGVGDLPYEAPVTWGDDDAELYNQASGSRVGGPTYTVADEASQDPVTGYGVRPLGSVDGLWNRSDGEVVDLLTYRVSKYAQPVRSVRQIRLHPAAVPALYPYVLGLGLRSRITVKVAPPGGGPVFSQESHIERITHDVDASGDWWTTWDISAADTTPYWTLDDPVRGLLDSGNLIGF